MINFLLIPLGIFVFVMVTIPHLIETEDTFKSILNVGFDVGKGLMRLAVFCACCALFFYLRGSF
jgi:hypothetical protein